ncbi:MAG: hypothetical protein JWN67_4286 [Actinomycetia bacterium]|nr:hypothetical protein [Actinomycetes bacterium]
MPANHLDEAIGGWCPSCRTAFRPGFERCPDCDVELVDELSPPPPRRRLDAEPGDAVEYELGDWRDDQRDGLTLLLQVSEVPFAWEGTVVTVPPSAEAEVDALVDEIDGGADLSLDEAPDVGADAQLEHDDGIASRWARLGAYLVESLVVGTVIVILRRGLGAWVAEPLSAVYVIGTTAIWGQQLGKLVIGIRIVDERTGHPPTWLRAVFRWVVPSVPFLWAIQGPWLVPVLGLLWSVVVYAPILGADRRGLHDRAAGTIVVRAR